MKVKNFYEDWDQNEIDDYVKEYSVLILFKIHKHLREAEIIIHGKLSEKQKLLLKLCILGEFGGKTMSEDLCTRINEYAESWYNDYVHIPRKIRVLNFRKKGRVR